MVLCAVALPVTETNSFTKGTKIVLFIEDEIREVGRGLSLADTALCGFTQDDGSVRGVAADAQALLLDPSLTSF
jgi:hypothetical protein